MSYTPPKNLQLSGDSIATAPAASDSDTSIATTSFVKAQKLHDFALPTAATPMNSQKFTGLAAGTTAGDSLRYEQLFTAGTVTLLGALTTAGQITMGGSALSGTSGTKSINANFSGVLLSDSTASKAILAPGTLQMGLSSGSFDWALDYTSANVATVGAGDKLKHDTQSANDSSTTVATTEFVQTAVGSASAVRPMTRVLRTTTQSLSNGTLTPVSFDTERYDTDGMWTLSSPTRITFNTSGVFGVGAAISMQSLAAARNCQCYIRLNGAATYLATSGNLVDATAGDIKLTPYTEYNFTAGDYVEFVCYQASGSTMTIDAGSVSGANQNCAEAFASFRGSTGAAWGNAGALVYRSTTQSLTTAVPANIAFDSEIVDVDGMHSTVSNTERLTATIPGHYFITASVEFASNATGLRQLILVNSSGTEAFAAMSVPAISGQVTRVSVSGMTFLEVGESVCVQAYQNSGGALTVGPGTSAAPYVCSLGALRVGYQTNPADLPGTYVASMYAASSGAPTNTSTVAYQKVGSGGGTLTWTSGIDKRPSGVSAQVDTATNKRIDIRKTGLYRVGWSAKFTTISDAKTVASAVYLNGTMAAVAIDTTGLIAAPLIQGSKLLSLTSGDYLELYAFQNDSASEAYEVTSPYFNYLEIEYLGSAT